MKRYSVSFVPDALNDIQDSFEWGLEFWGKDAADKWLVELHEAVFQRLSHFPRSCGVAPESEDGDGDIRQLNFLRYRIVFEIRGNQVIVLRVAGPYRGVIEKDLHEN